MNKVYRTHETVAGIAYGHIDHRRGQHSSSMSKIAVYALVFALFYGKSPITNRKLGEDEKRPHEKGGSQFRVRNEVHIWNEGRTDFRVSAIPKEST
jgi:hypothetical protein